MTQLSHRELVDSVVLAVNNCTPRVTESPRTIAIGGYPYTGKTLLARDVASAWEGPSYVLPTESVISARANRLAHGQNGSSVDSHNMQRLVDLIAEIRAGNRMPVPQYSWDTGDFVASERTPSLGPTGLLVVDGSVATASSIIQEVDAAFLLRPERLGEWMELAVARDIVERNWNLGAAVEQNKAKEATVASQLTEFGSNPSEYLIIVRVGKEEPWTAQMLG